MTSVSDKQHRPPRERGESREKILEAASAEFAAHGFVGARIDTIAHRTSLNVRMIYYHFQSKEGLYQAVLEAIYRHMATVLEAAAAEHPAKDVAVAAFERFVDMLAQHPRFADILVREIVDGGARLGQLFKEHPDLYERLHLRARQLLDAGVAAGLLRPVDTALAVHSLTGMVCLLVAARAAQPLFLGAEVDAPRWKATLLDLFLNGLARRDAVS